MNLKKEKQKQTKQTTRTGTESQKWKSHGGLSAGRGMGENGEKGTGNKKHKWQVQNREGEVKNSMEKPKNLYVQPTGMNEGRNAGGRGVYSEGG